MKLLIAYDGSRCSEAAVDDLTRAGLPNDGECHVLSVADVWLPPDVQGTQMEEVAGIHFDSRTGSALPENGSQDEMVISEARTLANHAAHRVEKIFPKWTVTSQAACGSPASVILDKADQFSPDLIVVGSQGQTALSRLFLGSISQKVVTEASCSVRIGRGRIEVDPVTTRIVIGFDGSAGAQAAIKSVVRRRWGSGSEARLISVIDKGLPASISRFSDPAMLPVDTLSPVPNEWIEELADAALVKLESCGLRTSRHVCAGNAKEVIVREAEHWDADCIFVGANSSGTKFKRFLLGSTTSAIAARAHCSVEVARLAKDVS